MFNEVTIVRIVASRAVVLTVRLDEKIMIHNGYAVSRKELREEDSGSPRNIHLVHPLPVPEAILRLLFGQL